jgi:hypothetical protein
MAITDAPRAGSRVLLAATIAYALLATVALAAFGTLPAATETGAELVAWFRAHPISIRLGVWAFTVALPAFAAIAALIRGMLPAPHGEVFFLGATVYVATIAVWTWTWGGLALHAERLDPAIARTVLDVALFFGPVLTGATTTMMAPVTVLGLRGQTVPPWIGALGFIAFVEQSLETVSIFGATGFTQPGGAMNMQLGGGLTLAWILGVGFWGGLRGRPAVHSCARSAPWAGSPSASH